MYPYSFVWVGWMLTVLWFSPKGGAAERFLGNKELQPVRWAVARCDVKLGNGILMNLSWIRTSLVIWDSTVAPRHAAPCSHCRCPTCRCVGWTLTTVALGLIQRRVWKVSDRDVISSGVAWVGIWWTCFNSHTLMTPGFGVLHCKYIRLTEAFAPPEIVAGQVLMILSLILGLEVFIPWGKSVLGRKKPRQSGQRSSLLVHSACQLLWCHSYLSCGTWALWWPTRP